MIRVPCLFKLMLNVIGCITKRYAETLLLSNATAIDVLIY